VSVVGPCPSVAVSVIQLPSACADHAHSRAVLTTSVPVPPDAGTFAESLVTLTPHLAAEGPTLVLDDVPHAASTQSQATVSSTRNRIAPHRTPRIQMRTAPGRRAQGGCGLLITAERRPTRRAPLQAI